MLFLRYSLAAAVVICGAMPLDLFAVEQPTKPNILFIFSDDHACHAISAYGSKVNRTPNIDRIAGEGALFGANFCANSICSPSRASVLTGKHSHLNGVTRWQKFNGSQTTFPKLLQQAGYGTGIFGKWHLKSEPTGFSEWMVYPGQGHYYNPDYRTAKGPKRIEGYSVDVTTDLSIEFMERQKADGKPFLVMCQYKAPHRTWMPAPRFHDLFKGQAIPEPATLFDDYAGRASPAAKHRMGMEHLILPYDLKVPYKGKKVFDVGRMTPEQQAMWEAAYGEENADFLENEPTGRELIQWKYQRYIKDYLKCVAAVDDNIGRLLAFLDEEGLADNTLVIYSSDQGFYLGDHGWFDKRWMYEESFRMPLVMRWPGRIKPGTRVDELTQNIDFGPTFLEVAGAEVAGEMQGRSLLPLLVGEPVVWRDALYYHYYDHGGEHQVARHYGIRTKQYKLIHYYTTDEWELFDLEKDPQEMQSVYDDPDYAELREKLHGDLRDLKKFYGNDVFTVEDQERLEAEGQ